MNKLLLSIFQFLACLTVVFLVVIGWMPREIHDELKPNTTTEIAKLTKSTRPEISAEYDLTAKGVRILLVPGHDLVSSGTEYRGAKEEELARQLATELNNLLIADGRFTIITTRDLVTGEYTPEFSAYFASAETQIKRFRTNVQSAMSQLVRSGTIEEIEPKIKHNYATKDVSFRLYGINKWANENNIDLAIHLHLNDYPRKDRNSPGKYRGFAMYIPEKQFANSADSRLVADEILQSLRYVSATSTFPLEAETIVETQDLIAAGSYNSQTHPAVLIEYGYIYEPKFSVVGRRDKTLPILAEATYRGLVRHFFGR
ncbi:MAG: N-acetylmuramoyl-L-alanine amidase [Patescibacteria group bacterium]